MDLEARKLLESVATDEGLTDYKIEESAGSSKGDNYMGLITSVQITGKTKSEDTKTLNLILKCAATNEAVRAEAAVDKAFDREIYLYNTIIPEFRKLQSQRGLEPFCKFPKCYKVRTEDKKEALVLENLKAAGYKLWDRKIPMDDEHVTMVLTEYARFHALSFGLHDQQKAHYENLVKRIDNMFEVYLQRSDFTGMYVKKCDMALGALDPITDKAAFEKLTTFKDEIAPYFYSLAKLHDNYSVINHGDCWTNNILFKYEDINNPKKPTDMCIIDLQIATPAPPVLDVFYYFYSCCSKQVIDNWKHYSEVYYNSLSSCLKELGSNPSEVYPLSVFQQHWKDHAKYGLITALFMIHLMLTEQDEATTLVDASESGKSMLDAFDYDISNQEEYKDRIRHVVLHFVNNNLI